MKTILLAMLLSQVIGQAKLIPKSKPEIEQPCKITEADKKECAKSSRVPVCVQLGKDWTYRCDKSSK